MILFHIFLQFIRSECSDYEIPSHSRSFINSLRSLKSSRTMLLFGVDSYADFPIVSNFTELKGKVLPFLMGQFYTNFLIIILGLVAIFFFLSSTILITTCCTPRERSKPGFFTTIIWWIIFSILFLVSIIYFILSIAYAPNFINNFHEIPEIVQNGFSQVINSTNQYIKKYEKEVINTVKIFPAVYPSMALLMSDSSTTVIDTFINHLNKLNSTLEKINDCDEKLNCTLLHQYINTFHKNFDNISEHINTYTNPSCSNSVDIYKQNTLTIPVAYAFSNLKWTEAQMSIDEYRFNEIEKSKKSFDTDRDYVNIPLKCINIILLILVIVFYVFQTITFFTQWAFSRCCVISIYPISIVASVGITIFGIFATSVACSIGDVCADSSRFVSQYFFLRNETRKNYPFPVYNPNLFDTPNGNLFTAIGGEYLFNFDDIIEIENTSSSNDVVQLRCNMTAIIEPEILDGNLFSYSEIYEELMKLHEYLSRNYWQPIFDENNVEVDIDDIRNVIETISDVNYKYDLQIHAISTLKLYSYFDPYNYSFEYFNKSIYEFIPSLRDAALNNNNPLERTASFCCPVRQTKKVLCKDTASTFSCFSIFAHFYLLSLIGFGIVLCFRRQGMLSSNYGIDDDKNDNDKKRDKKRDQSSDFEPRSTDFIRSNQGPYNQNAWAQSDGSESESRSSFTTLDMYAQSKIL